MKKFSEIEYVRPDMEAEQEKVRAYTKALKEAKSYEELRGLFMEEKTREDAWATMAEVAQVRYTVDTRDSFYEGEVQFWNETIPAIHLLIQKAEKVILESPFIKEFAEEFGGILCEEYGGWPKISGRLYRGGSDRRGESDAAVQ